MAGGAVATNAGPRRALDSEINMIPMIDLLMVTISFLLITAVWTHLARVDATANVPGLHDATPEPARLRLHVEMRDPARFVLHWNDGPTVVRTVDVPRLARAAAAPDAPLRFPELASALAEEHLRTPGASDGAPATLVLHTSDDAPYSAIIAAMDAAYAVKGACRGGRCAAGFAVTLATN
jgi:biopolymer transport protein ExbD